MTEELTPKEAAERAVRSIFRKHGPKLKAAIRAMLQAGDRK